MHPKQQQGLDLLEKIKDRTSSSPRNRQRIIEHLKADLAAHLGKTLAETPAPDPYLVDYIEFISAAEAWGDEEWNYPHYAEQEPAAQGDNGYVLFSHHHHSVVLKDGQVYEQSEDSDPEDSQHQPLEDYCLGLCQRWYADFERRFANRQQLARCLGEVLAHFKKLYFRLQPILANESLQQAEELPAIRLALAHLSNTLIREPYLERYQPDFFYWYEKAWNESQDLGYWLAELALNQHPADNLLNEIFQSVAACRELDRLCKIAYQAPDATVQNPSELAQAYFTQMLNERIG